MPKLQALLKQNFTAEYNELIEVAVRRNEGVTDQALGQELTERFQDIMRGKLKYGPGRACLRSTGSRPTRRACFMRSAPKARAFCLKMLGKDDTPATAAPPESVRQLMRLGTLYRFQAIAEGMPNPRPVEPLTADEMRAFEASLARGRAEFKDVSTGAFLNKGSAEPGKPVPDDGDAPFGDCAACPTARAARSTPACSFSAATSEQARTNAE